MKFNIPEYKPVLELSELERDAFIQRAYAWIDDIKANQGLLNCKTSTPEIQTRYREYLEKSIDLQCYDGFIDTIHTAESEYNFKFWALPKQLEHKAYRQAFPVDQLPDVLRNYLQAVMKYDQVPAEMCILPLLSTIAMCVHGKCEVEHPHNHHKCDLNVYTLTVAPPSARKSSARNFFEAAEKYEFKYNERHELDRIHRATEIEIKKAERKKAVQSKNLELTKKIDKELQELPEIAPMKLKISDCTPEALVQVLFENNERIAVLDTEGGVLSTIARKCNGDAPEISIFCEAFDGEPHTRSRVTTGTTALKHPILTLGLLTQPKKFYDFMANDEFMEKGFIYRFLFSFPESNNIADDFKSEPIPEQTLQAYTELIERLLQLPDVDQTLKHTRESAEILHNYNDMLLKYMQDGNIFENMLEYGKKQFTNALKICGLLHLCEHEPHEPIDGRTALRAVIIMTWCNNQAIQAFGGEIGESSIVTLIKRIIEKMKKGKQEAYTIRELQQILHINKKDTPRYTELIEALELMEDKYYIRCNKAIGERGCKLYLNPIFLKCSKQ